MGRKGNLVVFGSSNISKTREVTPTKIGVNAHLINPYRSEREVWPFLRVAVSLKPESPCPSKLVCMHLTST